MKPGARSLLDVNRRCRNRRVLGALCILGLPDELVLTRVSTAVETGASAEVRIWGRIWGYSWAGFVVAGWLVWD